MRDRRQRRRRSSRKWREIKRRMRWAWFYLLAALLVAAATMCALRE